MNQKGIAIAGNLITDIGYTIDQYPKKGNLTWMYEPKVHTGGVNNILVDLARMDPNLPLKVSGLIGDDENGKVVLNTLKDYPNINIHNITAKGRSAVTYAMTERSSKQRTFFYDPGTTLEYDETYIDWEVLDADIFHLEYLLLLGTLDEADDQYGTKASKVLYEAKSRGMKTSIDVVSEESVRYSQVVLPALKYTDYCIINEVEAEGATGIKLKNEENIFEENMWQALEKLGELGVQEWAVIHSPQCGYGLNCKTNEKVKVKSRVLPEGYIKGTTGAGDAYCAGVLYGAYKGTSIREALEIGVHCASCSLSAEDSNSGVVQF
ncbi:MAG: carbohydrate kinase family protein [Lachnospiraceae bacterium]